MLKLSAGIPKWAIGAVLIAAAAIALLLRFAHWPDRDPISVSKLRFLSRSERIFRQITRSKEQIHTTIGIVPARRSDKGQVPGLVRVQMCDEAHEAEVVLDWETTSGELNRVSNFVHDHAGADCAAFGVLEAAKISLRRLNDLEITSTAPVWKLDSPPRLVSGGLYFAEWRAPDKRVLVTIQAQTGELSSVKVRPAAQR